MRCFGLHTITNLCADLDINEFVGHAFLCYSVLLDDSILRKHQCSPMTHILALVMLVFTCTPDSPGFDLARSDDYIADYLLEEHNVTQYITAQQVFYERDAVCKHYDYNFSKLRFPIFLQSHYL